MTFKTGRSRMRAGSGNSPIGINAPEQDFIQQDTISEDEEEDEFTSNSVQDEQPLVVLASQEPPPRDRYWTVYLAFSFLGITTLLPWNFFINADKYWMYKFRLVNTTGSDIPINDYTSHPHGKTPFQASFTSYLAIASNVPSTLFFVLNLIIAKWISAKRRMIVSLTITLLFFLSQTVLVKINTDDWQGIFFIVTLTTVVLMNAFCTLFQCGLFGIIGKFPHSYTTATMSGQALGGIFAAVANVLTVILAADETSSAFIYFLLGTASLVTSLLIVTLLLPKLSFYQIYMEKEKSSTTPIRQPGRTRAVFRKVWIPTVSAAMTFLVTLAVFPTLLTLVVSETAPSVWSEKYYVPVVSFGVMAIGDYVGRLVSGRTHWPGKRSYWMLVLSLMRLSIIPLVMICNVYPRQHLPVLLHSDIYFTIITAIFGFTNGYLTNIVFMNAPQLVNRDEQEEANGIVTMGLGLGLSLGVTLSYFVLMAL